VSLGVFLGAELVIGLVMVSTISNIELIFAVMVAIGLSASLYSLQDAWKDRTYAIRQNVPEKHQKDVTTTFAIVETSRAIQQLLLLVVAVWGFWLPSSGRPTTTYGRVVILALLVHTGLLTYNSIVSARLRRRMGRRRR
jgi:hypothetical protein